MPEVVVFCNKADLLDASYKKFLDARIREEQPWPGLPILLHFRERKGREKPE